MIARPAVTATLAAALALAAAGCRGSSTPAPADEPASQDEGAGAPPAAASPGPAPIQSAVVEIYFPSATGDLLIGESREIFLTATPGDRVKQIVSDLIAGPSGEGALRALPAATRLRQVYVLDDGTAWLDFSSDLVDGLGGGTANEILAVYAIVDSVVMNVSDVRRVGILIEGRPVETLNGHLDVRRPLRPNMRLIGRKAEGESQTAAAAPGGD